MNNYFENKSVLVTGGVGSIGSSIVREILNKQPKVVRVYDNSESGLFELEQSLNSPLFRPLIGDVRDKERLRLASEDTDIIFHAAALKHVPLNEYNPFEAVKTNVSGTQNVIEVALENEVEKLITISTDKAVDPINVMGATKLLAERLTISANYYKGKRKTVFACTRFGNVLGSRGSVTSLFIEQVKHGGPVTITDGNMTRFVMSVTKAVQLVVQAAEMAKGGEIFIFKMDSIRVADLARAIIEEFGPKYGFNPDSIKVEIIGRRPGEKDDEKLINNLEINNIVETSGMYIVDNFGNHTLKKVPKTYSFESADANILSHSQIRTLLKESLLTSND